MPRRILRVLAAGLCGLGWRSGAAEGDAPGTPDAAIEEGSDTFVYDLPEKG